MVFWQATSRWGSGISSYAVVANPRWSSGDYGAPDRTPNAQDDINANINFTHLHPEYAAIFNDVMRDTNHPVVALQVCFTVLFQSAYYDLIDRFHVLHNIMTISFVQALKPASMSALLAVTAALALHITVTASTS